MTNHNIHIHNTGALPLYSDIEPELKELCEDLIWNRDKDATEKMLAYAQQMKASGKKTAESEAEWRQLSVEERLSHALVKGIDVFVSHLHDQYKYFHCLGMSCRILKKRDRTVNSIHDLSTSSKDL